MKHLTFRTPYTEAALEGHFRSEHVVSPVAVVDNTSAPSAPICRWLHHCLQISFAVQRLQVQGGAISAFHPGLANTLAIRAASGQRAVVIILTSAAECAGKRYKREN
jgi:hypothetical protein